MSLKDVLPGDKIGKAVSMRYIESKEKKTPGVEICFKFTEPTTGGTEQLNWIGWLSEKAIHRTMETLVNVLGYNGSLDTDASGNYSDEKVLDFKREVKLVVEVEEGEDGKEYHQIRWVNTLGGSQFEAIEPKVVKAKLAQIGFKAAFLAAKSKSSAPVAKKAAAPAPVQEDDVPY